MEHVRDYLVTKHQSLGDNYTCVDDRRYAESCILIAGEVAQLLLAQGLEPRIVIFSPRLDTERWPESLRPLPYRKNRVRWGAHAVCCAGDMVFDPMLGEPVSLADYPRRAFGTDVSMKLVVPPEKMRDYLAR